MKDAMRKLGTVCWPLQGHHERFVFTYICRRTRLDARTGHPELLKGQRYPVTKEGLKTAWRRVRTKAGVAGEGGFRFHDWRHDLASKTLRETGNLKLVQRMLNHSKIATTTKYSHILDDEIAAALQARAEDRIRKAGVAETGSPQNSPQNDEAEPANSLEFNCKTA
jgi:Phage integrase family